MKDNVGPVLVYLVTWYTGHPNATVQFVSHSECRVTFDLHTAHTLAKENKGTISIVEVV